jgi:hypothetical protein
LFYQDDQILYFPAPCWGWMRPAKEERGAPVETQSSGAKAALLVKKIMDGLKPVPFLGEYFALQLWTEKMR